MNGIMREYLVFVVGVPIGMCIFAVMWILDQRLLRMRNDKLRWVIGWGGGAVMCALAGFLLPDHRFVAAFFFVGSVPMAVTLVRLLRQSTSALSPDVGKREPATLPWMQLGRLEYVAVVGAVLGVLALGLGKQTLSAEDFEYVIFAIMLAVTFRGVAHVHLMLAMGSRQVHTTEANQLSESDS